MEKNLQDCKRQVVFRKLRKLLFSKRQETSKHFDWLKYDVNFFLNWSFFTFFGSSSSFVFEWWYLSLTQSFSVISEHITVIMHCLKLFFELQQQSGSVFTYNYFDVICPNTVEFGEIMRTNDHYTVRGHSRSPFSVPIEAHI